MGRRCRLQVALDGGYHIAQGAEFSYFLVLKIEVKRLFETERQFEFVQCAEVVVLFQSLRGLKMMGTYQKVALQNPGNTRLNGGFH